MRFTDLVEVSPKVELMKGREYPFVEMAVVTPGSRYVSTNIKRTYKGGGARFEAGDTLFARITPCLEHGKIAQYSGEGGKVGFGSTEFFVFRHRGGISNPGYVFYLSSSGIVRKPAEKSMSGASGRQRADLNIVKDLRVPAPPLPTQRKVAAVLSAYDDLIENNIRRIKILEEMARLLYREWFVHFRFAGHEQVRVVDSPLGPIPEGWDAKPLGEICSIVMGQSPKSKFYNEEGEGLPFHQGVKDFGDTFPTTRVYCTVTKRIAEAGDILFSVRAPVGRMNIAGRKIVLGRGLCGIRSRTGNQAFVLLQLRDKFQDEDMIGGGTIFKSVTKADMHGIRVLAPPHALLAEFEQLVSPMFAELGVLTARNTTLRRTRDLLLPRLISGAIDVAGLDIDTGGKS